MKLEVISYGNHIAIIPIGPIKNLKGSLKGIDTEIIRERDREIITGEVKRPQG